MLLVLPLYLILSGNEAGSTPALGTSEMNGMTSPSRLTNGQGIVQSQTGDEGGTRSDSILVGVIEQQVIV